MTMKSLRERTEKDEGLLERHEGKEEKKSKR